MTWLQGKYYVRYCPYAHRLLREINVREEKTEAYHCQYYYSLPTSYMPIYLPAVSWERTRIWGSQEAGQGDYKEFIAMGSGFKALGI